VGEKDRRRNRKSNRTKNQEPRTLPTGRQAGNKTKEQRIKIKEKAYKDLPACESPGRVGQRKQILN